MAGKEHEATIRAVARYTAGESVRAAATAERVSEATLNRALNKRGIVRRGPLKGPDHHAYIDGRRSAASRR